MYRKPEAVEENIIGASPDPFPPYELKKNATGKIYGIRSQVPAYSAAMFGK
jgi:hypothetical protein